MAIVGTQPMHMDYVVAAANLRANLYGIPQNRDYSAIARMLDDVKVPEFTPRAGVKIEVTEAEVTARNDAQCGKC